MRHAAVFGEGRRGLVALLDADAEVDMMSAIAALNRDLAPAERVRAFRIVPPFSVEGGELTPSLKLQRAAVERRHAALLEDLLDEVT